MMAMTTSNSISVKPRCEWRGMVPLAVFLTGWWHERRIAGAFHAESPVMKDPAVGRITSIVPSGSMSMRRMALVEQSVTPMQRRKSLSAGISAMGVSLADERTRQVLKREGSVLIPALETASDDEGDPRDRT